MTIRPPEMRSRIKGREVAGIPNWEGRALAFIIVALKMLFGLDDSTEKYQSKCASKVNQILTEERDRSDASEPIKTLFVWQDWVEFIEFRNSFVAQHYFPAQAALDPDELGDPDLYLKFRKSTRISFGEPSKAKCKYCWVFFFLMSLSPLSQLLF